MAYCTEADIKLAYGDEVVDNFSLAPNQEGGIQDSSRIVRAIDWGDNVIDSRLYQLSVWPPSSTPGRIRDICVDLSMYFLQRSNGQGHLMLEAVRDIIAELDAYAKGKQIPGLGLSQTHKSRSTTNDGRRREFEKSNYNESSGDRIQSDTFLTRLDDFDR